MSTVSVDIRVTGAADAQRAVEGVGEAAVEANKNLSSSFDNAAKSAEKLAAPLDDVKNSIGSVTESSKSITGQLGEAAESGKGFGDVLESLKSKVVDLVGPIGAAAAAIGGLGIKMAFSGFEDAEKIRIMAERIGATAEAVSVLSYQAKLADVPIEKITSSLATLQLKMGQGKVDQDLLSSLGIGKEFMDAQPDKQILALAEAMDKLGSTKEKMAALTELFGRGGKGLLPLFTDGAEGLKKAAEELKTFNGVISTDTTKETDKIFDNFTRFSTALAGVRNQLAADLAPSIRGLSDALVYLVKDSGALKAFTVVLVALADSLIFVARIVASVVVVFSTAFGQIGRAMGGISAALDAFIHGDFVRGTQIMKDALSDLAAHSKEAQQALQDIWNLTKEMDKSSGTGKKIEEIDKKTQGLKKSAYEATQQLQLMNVALTDTDMGGGELIKTSGSSGSTASAATGIPNREDWDQLRQDIQGFSVDFSRETARMLTDATAKWQDYFKRLGEMISSMIIERTIARPIANGVDSVLGKIFGGALGGAAGGGSSSGDIDIDIFGSTPTLSAATGGLIPAMSAVVVGEDGPEIIGPASNARRVTPNSKLGGGGGGVTVVQNFTAGVTRAELASLLPVFRDQAMQGVIELSRRGAV